MDVAESLGINNEIDLLPGGLDCQFDGAGRSFGSPGLFKKISLAGVLAAESDLLLLDNPYSALDVPSQHRLTQLLVARRGQATTCVTGPDPKLIAQSDLHIVLRPDADAEISHPRRDATLADWDNDLQDDTLFEPLAADAS